MSLVIHRASRVISFGTLFVLASTASPAVARKPTIKSVHRLLALSGAAQMGDQIIDQLVERFRQNSPDVDPRYWNTLKKNIEIKELVNDVAILYTKHFDQKDIDGLIRFYSSPLGRKFVRKQPQLLQESMSIGNQWAQKLAQRIMRDIESQKNRKKKKGK